MLKKLGIVMICTLIIISTLTGCKQEASQGKPGGDAPVVVSVWYSLTDKEEEELLSQLERIENENPQILVRGEKIVKSDFADYVWKIQAGGQGPDIIIADITAVTALYEKGAVSPVLIQSTSGFASAERTFTFTNELYALPWLTDVPILYYRKDKVKELPDNLNDIFTEKQTVAVRSLSTNLLAPWWKAEGGSLSLSGIPQLNSQANKDFVERILYLIDQKLLIVDDKPLDKLTKGEASYVIAWASESHILDNRAVGFLSLEGLLGRNARPLLDKTIGIANSSMITDPIKKDAVRLVEEELMTVEAQMALMSAGKRVPANKEPYQQTQSSFNNELLKSIDNSWILPGNHPDRKYINIQDTAWNNIFGGAEVESELEEAQQSALKSIGIE